MEKLTKEEIKLMLTLKKEQTVFLKANSHIFRRNKELYDQLRELIIKSDGYLYIITRDTEYIEQGIYLQEVIDNQCRIYNRIASDNFYPKNMIKSNVINVTTNNKNFKSKDYTVEYATKKVLTPMINKIKKENTLKWNKKYKDFF